MTRKPNKSKTGNAIAEPIESGDCGSNGGEAKVEYDGKGRATAFGEWRPMVLLLIVPLVLFVVAQIVTQPFVFPDEAGAITNARFLAGRGARSQWWYLPGYGALLAPVLAFTNDLRLISLSIHVLNAGLGALTALGLFFAGRTWCPSISPRKLAIAAVATCLYPAFLYLASIAMADNLLITGSVWSVLFVDRVRRRPPSPASYGLALLLGAFMAVHSRAVTIVFAAILVLALESKARRYAIVATVAAAITVVVSRMALDTTDQSVILLGAIDRNGIGGLLRANASVRSVSVIPFTFLGQILNVVTATAGLIVLGVASVVRLVRHPDFGSRLAGIQVSVMIAGTGLSSALFSNEVPGDFAIYGRYLEAVIALPLFFGIVHLIARPIPVWFGTILPPALVASGITLICVRGTEAFAGRMNVLNFTGIALVVVPAGRINPIAIAVAGAVLSVLVWRLSLISRPAALAFVAASFLGNAAVPYLVAHVQLQEFSAQNELSADIRQAVGPDLSTCVGLDQSSLENHWGHENYRVHNLDLEFEFWQSASGQPTPCPGVVVSSRGDLDTVLPGWRAVAWESGRPHWLWLSPEIFERSSTFEAVLPLRARPTQSLTADLDIKVQASSFESGEFDVLVSIANNSESTFIPPSYLGSVENSVRLTLEWRKLGSPEEKVHEPIRLELAEPLSPGEMQVVPASISIGLIDTVNPHGEWTLHAELTQESGQSSELSVESRLTVELPRP